VYEQYVDEPNTPVEDETDKWCERREALVDLFRTLDPATLLGDDE